MPGCAAPNCSNRPEKGFIMKVFPKDPRRREEWAKRVQRKNWTPTNRSVLCEVHFDSSMWEKTREDGSRRLRTNAIPTIFPSSKPKRTIQRYTAKSMLIPETTATTHYYSTQSTSFWTPVNISPVSNDKKSTSTSTPTIDTIDSNSSSCDETDPMTPICVIEEFFSMEELIVKNRDLQQKNKKLNRNNQEMKMALDIALNKIKELESKLDKKNIVYDSKELINMNPYLIKIESKR